MAMSTTTVDPDSSRNFLNPVIFGSLSQGQEHFFNSPFTADIYWKILRNMSSVRLVRDFLRKKKRKAGRV